MDFHAPQNAQAQDPESQAAQPFDPSRYGAQDLLFSDLDLSQGEPADWAEPKGAKALVDLLHRYHLILLAGPELRDEKSMIARYLALRLREKLLVEGHAEKEEEVLFREWYRRSDPQKIEAALAPDQITILLLPNLERAQLESGLHPFRTRLSREGHYAILTTEAGPADWDLGESTLDRSLWQELTAEHFFGPTFLTRALVQKLEASRRLLPENLISGPPAQDYQLLGGPSIAQAAARLKQPSYIRSFVLELASYRRQPITAEELEGLFEQFGGDQHAVMLWYRQLERKDQLLALALTLFDGLPEDQAFAALEVLIRKSWREADPLLEFFDYRDLDRLSAYIKLKSTGRDSRKIDVPRRREVLCAAWCVQRRRLLAVLPTLTALIKGLAVEIEPGSATADTPAAKERSALPSTRPEKGEAPAGEAGPLWRSTDASIRELYNTPQRQKQLQQAVIDSLSQIGFLSLEATEPCFLELAMEGRLTMQRVVAKALARWPEEKLEADLWGLLGHWWSQGVKTRGKLLEGIGFNDRKLAALRSAVALVVAYAAERDPVNHLSQDLCELFGRLLEDRDPVVRGRFLDETLPRVVRRHPLQMEPVLRAKALLDDPLLKTTAFSLSLAYRGLPGQVQMLLTGWQSAAREMRPSGPREVEERERLLAAVALTYGFLDVRGTSAEMSIEQVYHELRSILAEETHPFIRRNALFAIGFQAIYHFEQAGPLLQELIGEVTLADRHQLVADFTAAYLNQREALVGGDEQIEIDGRSFGVWLHSNRPLTAIEVLLYAWLRDGNQPVAQQVAVEAFAAIGSTALERQERALIARGGSQAWIPQGFGSESLPWRLEKLCQPPLLGQMAVFLTAPRDRETRELLTPVFSQVVALPPGSGGAPEIGIPASESLVTRWQGVTVPGIPSLTQRLEEALRYYRIRWVIVFFAFLFSYLLVGKGLPGLYHWIAGPPAAPASEIENGVPR